MMKNKTENFNNVEEPANYTPNELPLNNYYERKQYRLPYRYPVGFKYNSPVEHVHNIHAYDINS